VTRPAADVIDTDVLIIGAGPSGLFAAYYAGLRGLSVVLIDSLPEAGGQLTALYPDKPIYDVAGLPAVTGAALTRALVTQADGAGPTWLLGEQALDLVRPADGAAGVLGVLTDRDRRIRAGGVIIAAGIGGFRPRRLPAAQAFLGRGLHYTLQDAGSCRDRDVVIVGGGDSAVDWANMLHPVARSLTLIHRRRTLRAHATSVSRLRQSAARIILDGEVVAAHGNGQLESVSVLTRGGATTEQVKAQIVIAALGHIAELGPLSRWGIALDGRQIVVDQRMATSVPGVFAAGDVTTYPGKVKIMAVGFGEAATAVNNLAVLLRPGEAVFPGHSTELMRNPAEPAGPGSLEEGPACHT
jgi:ferredoxin/flavodoxin---NADP+ reductase